MIIYIILVTFLKSIKNNLSKFFLVSDTLINSAKKLDFRDNSDTVVYFCGTIKNLSENQKLLKLLASKNIEETLVKIIKELSKYVRLNYLMLDYLFPLFKYKDNETLKSEAGHALVQVKIASF